MCFLLYSGTSTPLPTSKWNASEPHVYARDLNESESSMRSIFSKPNIQYIGSTTCCGCAFPSVIQGAQGDWPYWLDPLKDASVIVEQKQECDELCELLSKSDEAIIELYGIWAGNEGKPPLVREEITLEEIRRELFRFKESGFYRVKLR